MDKIAMRDHMLKQRQSITGDVVRTKSLDIAKRIQSFVTWEHVKRIHVYRSNALWHEVDTSWVEGFIFAMWPNVEVTIGVISPTAPLPQGTFDLVLVPIVAFDDRLNRLGFGGGWYDRFLVSQPDAVTIGLAYDFQEVTQLYAEPHDIQLSYIVTESHVFE